MFSAAFAAVLLLVAATQCARAADPLLMSEVRLAQATGDHELAVDLLEKAYDETPESEGATREALLEALGEALSKAGRHLDAGYVFAKLAREKAGRLGKTSPELSTHYEAAGMEFEKAGELELALSAFKRVLKIDRPVYGDEATSIVLLFEKLAELSERAGDSAAQDLYAALADGREHPSDPQKASRTFFTQSDNAQANESALTSVKLYYATDRKRSGSLRPNDFFSGERGTLSFGMAEVTIPRSHKPGMLEAPSLITLEVSEDTSKHVVLRSVTPLSNARVFEKMRAHLETSGSDEAFVFVHGYNVPFAWAARRTAQLAYDLNFTGLPILYSWPSRGNALDYMADTAVVRLSGRRLSAFLDQVVEVSGAKRVHLIAHSMGNRALTDALELMALRHKVDNGEPLFEQILFTAPDLDAGLFAEMIKTIRPIAKRMTLYASQKDLALLASRRVHGDAPRAGEGGDNILLADGLDSVDMTALGNDILGHNYFSDHASALTDMLSLFWQDAAPLSRCGMIKRARENRSYWLFDPTACRGAVRLSALSLIKAKGQSAVDFAKAMVDKLRQDGNAKAVEEWREIETVVGALMAEVR